MYLRNIHTTGRHPQQFKVMIEPSSPSDSGNNSTGPKTQHVPSLYSTRQRSSTTSRRSSTATPSQRWGKVVPTWDYGRAKLYYFDAKDAATDAFLTRQIVNLTRIGEEGREGMMKGFEGLGSYVGSEMAKAVKEREKVMVR